MDKESLKTSLQGVKGIIFDYGGTIDSGGAHWSEVIWTAWQKAGIAATKEEFRVAYVYAERELARTLHILPHHNFHDLLLIKMRIELQQFSSTGNFPAAQIEPKAEETARYCYESAKGWVERARPVLEQLSKRYPLVLVSNFYGNVESVLSDFKIEGYFKKIIESAVVGVRKPDPQIFRLGVEALGMKPEDVLVVGDSYSKDIVPAESIGCKVLWLKGKGWTQEEDDRLHPAIISGLDDVLTLLDGE